MAKLSTALESPGWWLTALEGRLQERIPRFRELKRYDSGNHPLPEGDERVREMFQRFQRKARSNYTGLVIEAVLERMHVIGFRAGEKAQSEQSDEGIGSDDQAWRIWQANRLDARSDLVHRGMLTYSKSYVIVGPNAKDQSTPLITPETPRQVIADVDPTDRYTVRAALKKYEDPLKGGTVAVVYLPDSVHPFLKRKGEDWSPQAVQPNRSGVVPVVPFNNRPQLDEDEDDFLLSHQRGVIDDCMSELAGLMDIQDRINNTILDRLVISKMQAYRQRWAKGITTEDEEGNPIDLPFVPGVDLLWAVEDETVSFGDFASTDLSPILKATEADIRDLAAISRTPPHYLLGEIVNASGDALKAAETGLVSKVLQRQRHAAESWEKVMNLVGHFGGYPELQTMTDTEILWRDPESRTMAELASSAIHKRAAGVTWRQCMEDMGYTPQQIERMDEERRQDALLAQTLAPLAMEEGGEISTRRGVNYTATLNDTAPEPGSVAPPATGK